MTYQIRVKLLNNFEELRERKRILPYYVSLEFPEKQSKLISWWSHMIEEAIKCSNQAYLSPSDLEVIFTLHGLKPVPLPQVLSILANTKDFQWRDKISQNLNKSEIGIKQIFTSIFKFVIPQKSIGNRLTKFEGLGNDRDSKIISGRVMKHQLDKLKRIIEKLIGDENFAPYDFIIERVKNSQQCQMSTKSIEFLVAQLHHKCWVVVAEVNKKKIVLYSHNIDDYDNQKWVDLQKLKFTLKLNIHNLNNQIDKKLKEENQLLHLAKNAAVKDQAKAKQILSKVLNTKNLKVQMENRVLVLESKLSEIQINETTGRTVELLGDVQKVLKEVMVDPEKLDKIAEDNAEISMNQKQINSGFERLNDVDEQLEDQVDEMMRELQNDVKLRKNKEKESPAPKFVGKDKAMDIDDILKMTI